ncbi:MAG: hypothetical protein WEH44_08945 [Pirellulaceae bacterium]
MRLSWIFLLAAALLSGWLLCGCSHESGTMEDSSVSAASRSPGERIAGAWQGSMLVDDDAVEGKISDQQRAQLEAMQMGMEFRDDGSLVLTGVHDGQPYTSRNRWKLLRESGEEALILSTEPSGAQKEIVLVFEGEDVFLLPMKTEVAELGAMRFERLR